MVRLRKVVPAAFKHRQQKYYYKNREVIIKKATARKRASSAKLHRYICQYLVKHPCVDCGQNNIVVLQFDHVRGRKKAAIGEMQSLEALKAEIKKCEVRCANCHIMRHAKQQRTYRYRWLVRNQPDSVTNFDQNLLQNPAK